MRNSRFVAAGVMVVGLGTGVPALAGPGDHRWEVGLSFDHRTFDSFVVPDLPGFPGSGGRVDPPDNDTWRASGTFYFQQVETDDVPLAEAAYLGRNSSATLSWSHFDADIVELEGQELRVDYYVPNTMFFVAAGLSRFENARLIDSVVSTEHDTDWYGVVGITPFDGLRVTTFYAHDAGYDPNVSVKYVGKLGSASRFYGFGVHAADPDGGDLTIGGDFDFYFDATLSVGVGYEELDDRWTVRAEKFLTPRFGVQGSVQTADRAESFRIQAAYRF